MRLSRIVPAVLLLALAPAVAAQSAPPDPPAGSSDGVVAVVDVGRLPIDLRRIERDFRQTTIREERDGLNLRYFVDVYAKAPEIVLFTKADNLLNGPVPYGGVVRTSAVARVVRSRSQFRRLRKLRPQPLTICGRPHHLGQNRGARS